MASLSVDVLKKQWSSFWSSLSPAKKVGLVAVAVCVLGGFLLLITLGGRPSFRPLFVNLAEEEAAAIVEKLRERKVAFRLSSGGRVIEVPEEHLYELRLAMATEGLSLGGGVGLELFDRNSFGATDFVQRVNLQRALQGELARTIRQFPQVAQARVHLSLPERTLFVREPQRPQATVVLQLHPGATMQPGQLQGIVHLVASSVQGMQPQDVHVVDTTGKILYSPKHLTEGDVVSSRILEQQAEVERRLEAKIMGILEPVLGPGKVVARVHVDLDSRRVEQTEEQYDPDKTAVRSEQRSTERSTGNTSAPGGVPGVMSNLAEAKPSGSQALASSYQRENETINYEVNRVTRRTVSGAGEIRRITVAVLVDAPKKAGATGEGKDDPLGRPREELRQYEELVKQAVGFNPQRGDVVQVASVPFERVGEGVSGEPKGVLQILESAASHSLAKYGVVFALGLLFLLLVVRPFVRGFLSALQRSIPMSELPRTVGELEAEGVTATLPHQTPSPSPHAAGLPIEVVKLAEMDPQRFAAALKAWMKQGE